MVNCHCTWGHDCLPKRENHPTSTQTDTTAMPSNKHTGFPIQKAEIKSTLSSLPFLLNILSF